MRGESDPQDLRTGIVGPAIEDTLRECGFTNDGAAREMGYGDNQTSLRRWIEESENPQLLKLWKLGPKFRAKFLGRLLKHSGVPVKERTLYEIEDIA